MGEEGLWLGNGVSIGFQVMSNCIVHHSLYAFFYEGYCYYYFFSLCFPIKLWLCQPTMGDGARTRSE